VRTWVGRDTHAALSLQKSRSCEVRRQCARKKGFTLIASESRGQEKKISDCSSESVPRLTLQKGLHREKGAIAPWVSLWEELKTRAAGEKKLDRLASRESCSVTKAMGENSMPRAKLREGTQGG